MINFELFEKSLMTIKEYSDKDQVLMDLVGEGVGTYTCDYGEVVISLLKSHFNGDVDEWIEWWMWDCDFGEDHCLYSPADSDEEISLSDVKEFYEFLIKHYGI